MENKSIIGHRIPVTILTGFLGAGKTTLLNKLIAKNNGRRLAIIENEFGEINIDSSLVVGVSDNIFELSNGCLCCSLNDDLVKVLNDLLGRENKPDHVIVETTGIADPAPVALSFLSDPEIQRVFRLDAIITLVDASHIEQQLEDQEVACRQVASADLILINKTDRVDPYVLDTVRNIIRRMNPLAALLHCQYGEVPEVNLLDIGGFRKEHVLQTKFEEDRSSKRPKLTVSAQPALQGSLLGAGVKRPVHSDIRSHSFVFPEPLDTLKFNIWLREVLNFRAMPVYRAKGILYFYAFDQKLIMQAVNNQVVTESGGTWNENEEHVNKLVFIGKHLERDLLEKGLRLCCFDKPFDPGTFYPAMHGLLKEMEERVKAQDQNKNV